MARAKRIEDDICIQFNSQVERLIAFGKAAPYFKMIHIPNEQARFSAGTAQHHMLHGKKLKAMGRKAGVWDYLVMWMDGWCMRMAWIEFKAEYDVKRPTKKEPNRMVKQKNTLSDEQKQFMQWLNETSQPKCVSYDVRTAVDFLVDIGAIHQ